MQDLHVDPPERVASTRVDAAGVLLSAVCGIHCVATPLLSAAGFAFVGSDEGDYTHYVLFAAAAPVTALAVYRVLQHRHSPWLLAVATLGLGLLWFGLSRDSHELVPTLITLAGALLLAGFHLYHWRLHRAARSHTDGPPGAHGH